MRDQGERWVRWVPDVEHQDPALARQVGAFEPVDTPAGQAAARWLKEKALINHPSTVTRLLLRDERVEGFYAICSAQVRLSQRDRKELTSGHHHTLHPIQPAALVAWIAKRHDAEISGRKLVAHAVFVASQVAELQGTIALVLDPHDGEVSRVWRERYGFRPAVAEEGKPTRRLWLPLHGLTD